MRSFRIKVTFLFQLENDKDTSLNIPRILLEMRRDRMGLIQTPEQLRFSYQAIIEGAKRLGITKVST